MDREEYYNALAVAHSGTNGMKWNKRKYQNPDGTWTELGKKMRREEYAARMKKKRKVEAKLAKKQAKLEKKQAKEDLKLAKERAEEYRLNYGSYVRKLSDEELRNKTTRLKAEKDYIDAEINRITIETKYKDLTKGPEKHPLLKAGMKKAAESMANNVSTSAGKIAGDVALYAGKRMVKSWFGDKAYDSLYGNNQNKKSSKERKAERDRAEFELKVINDAKKRFKDDVTGEENSKAKNAYINEQMKIYDLEKKING